MTRSLNLPKVLFFSVKSQELLAWPGSKETLQECWRGETLVLFCPPDGVSSFKHLERVWRNHCNDKGIGKHFPNYSDI